MMLDVVLIPVGVRLLIPARLLAWLALRQQPSRAAWALTVVFVAPPLRCVLSRGCE